MATYLTLDLHTGNTVLKKPVYNQNIPYEIIETNEQGYIDLVLIPEEVKNIVNLITEETILEGKLVTYTNNGTIKTYTYGDVCIGISFKLANINEECPVLVSGRFLIKNQILYNGPVYADINGNIAIEPYDIIQQIGYIVNNKLIINIQTPLAQLKLEGT